FATNSGEHAMSTHTDTMSHAIQQSMQAIFPQAGARIARLYQMQEYHLGWRNETLEPALSDSGKLLRPRLAILACQSVGGSMEQVLPLAAGIQLFHDFSLLHDDIQDVSPTRRGRATVWNVWGIAHAITAGDSLLALAHLAVHRLRAAGLSAASTLDVLHWFDETILAVCEGQYLDCSYEGKLDISEDDYLAMIRRKTASLIGTASGLGALIGGAAPDVVQAFHQVGLLLGMAFQVQDDILGIWGASGITGKPGTADLERRKVTLPIIRLLRDERYGGDVARIYKQPGVAAGDVQRLLALFSATSIQADMRALVRDMSQAARDALDAIPEFPSEPAVQARRQFGAMLAELLPLAQPAMVGG
ncbi:MAG TPA: polyprenyl synthetase family protein, partial [Roseiflexaceae bacterium]|nr:polyprenyl synthetase family protein [Roseiflexaceae bacterium]